MKQIINELHLRLYSKFRKRIAWLEGLYTETIFSKLHSNNFCNNELQMDETEVQMFLQHYIW